MIEENHKIRLRSLTFSFKDDSNKTVVLEQKHQIINSRLHMHIRNFKRDTEAQTRFFLKIQLAEQSFLLRSGFHLENNMKSAHSMYHQGKNHHAIS